MKGDDRVVEETPETRVDHWQRKLLDLTKRNPLLNVKSSALKLYCPDLGTLEDMLAGEAVFSFISVDKTPLMDSERSAEAFRLSTGNDLHTEFALEQLNKKTLIVNDTSKRKDTKLIELLRKAKNDLEEGGSNTLFLALGMLQWQEVEGGKAFRAPLILLPVKLERRSANAPVKLRQLPDEEPIFNLTLIEMLQTDYDINLDTLRNELPEDDAGVDVLGIWEIVRHAIREQPGFIVREEVVLGSFSFAKYLMWKDLRDRTDLLKQSPFVKHLVDHPSDAYSQSNQFVDRNEVDRKIKPESFFAPLNCDSSQMVAVEASSHAQDFVLEGPPGTGKSETIANIISHNLALGRKVLFVAEKMAALQVVYRRMEKVGLSHLCLELHSNKVNKKSVLEQLNNAWTKREAASQSDWIAKAQKLEAVRHGLNSYVSELHKKHALGLSARDTMARVVRYQDEHALRLAWPENLQQAPVKVKADLDPFLQIARDLGIAFGEVEDLDPRNFASITQQQFSNKWQADAVAIANRIAITAEQAELAVVSLADMLGTPIEQVTISTLEKLAGLSELAELAMAGEVDFALKNGGQTRLGALAESITLHGELHNNVAAFGHGLKWSMLETYDWKGWISNRDQAKGLFGFMKRYRLRKTMRGAGLDKVADLSILEVGLQAQETLKQLQNVSDKAEGAWTDVDASAADLKRILENGERALSLFKSFVSAFPDPTAPVSALHRQLIDGRDFSSDNSPVVSLARQVADYEQSLAEITTDAERHSILVSRSDALGKIVHDFKMVSEHSQRLSRWCRWLSTKKRTYEYALDPLAEALENRVIMPDACEDNAWTALCIWLAPKLIDSSPQLVEFAGASHESTIERFRMLDADVSATTSEYIIAKTAGKVPDPTGPTSAPEFGVLKREITKKSRHKPVRVLVNEMGSSLTDLTPCFMMSPLSVAQFLPADFALFDLVLFDEASQITTWDAVGAIARGKNVIVVGDPKQMPPSNNFGRKEDDDSDEGDLESILDQALAARLPHLRLTGHYRSRHETLIAFSNSHYYENQLTTFPSAETKKSAVSLHRVEGVYAKGKGQTNSIEAKAVVAEVVRRLERMLTQEKPLKTIGIVTINSQQQRMVEDFLDEARRKNVELEQFFTARDDFDPIFVKNLESVQGDERDIIVISLTYGPTEKGATTMGMNFGPLNKQGGERRLNVAVTRATTEVLVFSSFDSSMIDLSRTQATAVEHLKNYLEFAERGPIALAEYSTANYGVDQFDSDFEKAVAMTLREKGWKVQTQVGVSKFRVDLGVIHPDKPGEYLAGIECDGATYHGSPSARDRDRVRQAILENLGWRIVRLWSTDYFAESDYHMGKIIERLEELLAEDRSECEEKESSTEISLPSAPTEDVSEPESTDTTMPEGTKKTEINEPYPEKDTVELVAAAGVVTVSTHAAEAMEDNPEIDFLESLPSYEKDAYFNDVHRENLSSLARAILTKKNCITLHELTSDVASRHGLSRGSRKQRKHLREVIKSWVGFWREGEEKTTVFPSPDDVVAEIPWRGLFAFGV